MDGLEMSSDILAARELRFPAQNYASAISQEISQQLDNPERRHEPDGICSPELPDPALVEDAPQKVERQSVLVEAQGLVHGDRNLQYGPPYDEYVRTSGMVNAMLAHKLKEPLLPEEVAYIMECVKLSRQIFRPKRDNMVDGAGYCEVAQWIIDERANRAAQL
jgi:hypothetical protein